MKRTRQTELLVKDVNEHLRRNRITDEHDELFSFTCNYLLKHDMYMGFNYYKDGCMYDGEECIGTMPHLAGSGEFGKYEYLQIY